MMKCALTVVFILISITTYGQLDSMTTSLLQSLPNGTNIAIGTFDRGIINKYGFELIDEELKPVSNSDKLFELGSITKVFTTLVSLKALKEHNINHENSISRYWPHDQSKISKNITFAQLMTHTSGMPKMPCNFFWSILKNPKHPFLHYHKDRMISFLEGFNPAEENKFRYSNIGMGVLSYLITHLQNTSLDKVMKRDVFIPIDMNATSLGITQIQYDQVVNKPLPNKEPKHIWKFSKIIQGVGNAYSNIDDMTLFLQFILDEGNKQHPLIEHILLMENEQVNIDVRHGMGLGLRILKDDVIMHYHGGITYGFKSLMAYNRETQKGIIILSNAKGLSRKENRMLKEVCLNLLSQ